MSSLWRHALTLLVIALGCLDVAGQVVGIGDQEIFIADTRDGRDHEPIVGHNLRTGVTRQLYRHGAACSTSQFLRPTNSLRFFSKSSKSTFPPGMRPCSCRDDIRDYTKKTPTNRFGFGARRTSGAGRFAMALITSRGRALTATSIFWNS